MKVALKSFTSQEVKELRGIVKKALGVVVSVKKGTLKNPTVISVYGEKKNGYTLTDEQIGIILPLLKKLGFLDSLCNELEESKKYIYKGGVHISKLV